MMPSKLIQVGQSVETDPSNEALNKLDVEAGEVVCLADGPDTVTRIGPSSPAVALQIAMGERIMDEFRVTFRALAK